MSDTTGGPATQAVTDPQPQAGTSPSSEREGAQAASDAGAAAAGGTADPNPVQDLPVMYSRSFADPDGHVWETMWLDPAVLAG